MLAPSRRTAKNRGKALAILRPWGEAVLGPTKNLATSSLQLALSRVKPFPAAAAEFPPSKSSGLGGLRCSNVGAPTTLGLRRMAGHSIDPTLSCYFFLALGLVFSSTTACAAASREIGTRNGDALT
jgi:hypothetical protein